MSAYNFYLFQDEERDVNLAGCADTIVGQPGQDRKAELFQTR